MAMTVIKPPTRQQSRAVTVKFQRSVFMIDFLNGFVVVLL
jgi:hypothetical protein